MRGGLRRCAGKILEGDFMLYGKIEALVGYGIQTGLIEPDDAVYTRNRLLEAFCEDFPSACSDSSSSSLLRGES